MDHEHRGPPGQSDTPFEQGGLLDVILCKQVTDYALLPSQLVSNSSTNTH